VCYGLRPVARPEDVRGIVCSRGLCRGGVSCKVSSFSRLVSQSGLQPTSDAGAANPRHRCIFVASRACDRQKRSPVNVRPTKPTFTGLRSAARRGTRARARRRKSAPSAWSAGAKQKQKTKNENAVERFLSTAFLHLNSEVGYKIKVTKPLSGFVTFCPRPLLAQLMNRLRVFFLFHPINPMSSDLPFKGIRR
jgi:hypothetical protein